jgi:hypothetical protein
MEDGFFKEGNKQSLLNNHSLEPPKVEKPKKEKGFLLCITLPDPYKTILA